MASILGRLSLFKIQAISRYGLFSRAWSSIAPLLTLKAVGHIQLKENLQNEEDALLSVSGFVQARVKGETAK
jgi:hypothetical protein